MTTTRTDLHDGKRSDIEVAFVTRRAIDTDSGRVHRLIVEADAATESGNVDDRVGDHRDRSESADEYASDRQFSVLIAPGNCPLQDLRTGGAYRIRGLLGCDPLGSSEADLPECPDCGGALRQGRAIDTLDEAVVAAVDELGIDEAFGVLDEESSVGLGDVSGRQIDDWVPMTDQGQSNPEPPEFVCTDCGRHLDRFDLRERHEVKESVDEAPQAERRLDSLAYSSMESNAALSSGAAPDTVGMAAGGAKDTTSFRENVAEGYTPQPEAISDEGLFYDYHFETGERAGSGDGTPVDPDTEALFSPRYATAASEHPITDEDELYLSVGLDSTLSVEDFQRPRLDLVAVLDVSGSMDSAFDAYYYDEHGRQQEAEDDAETKIEAATESLCALTQQLGPEDRLGVVLYNNRAHVAKPLREVGATDMPAIRRHIREIRAGGSTNMADGFEAALDMLLSEDARPQTERRVVFMTDMMPNTGATGESELTDLFGDAAAEGVHTTFVGMGLDENAELAETLSGIRGANHYFVHSASEFERRLGEEFEYMVTPLVYDLALELEADGYEVAAVHGSPSAEAARGRLMHVGTLFPSPKEDGEARGGVVLARLERSGAASGDDDLELVASWTERGGDHCAERVNVYLPDESGTYDHDGIRKAVVLSRYARELRAWTREVHERSDRATGVDDWLIPDQRGQHERESVPLVVPGEYVQRFERLNDYLQAEMDALDDETLQKEVDLLATLCEEAPRTPKEARK